MPNPNGYDDFLRAGQLLVGNTDGALSHEELSELLARNAEALKLVKQGLTKTCRVLTDFSVANFSVHMNELASIKRLVHLLVAEGRLANAAVRPGSPEGPEECSSLPGEVTGPLKLVLHASSDAPDTDFVAKLVVYPHGQAINLAEGIIRARYRESLSRPKLMEPGKTYEFEINMLATSNVFLKGHRIRVDVTSSHFPQFDRNPNTGDPFGTSATIRVAIQTVQHSSAYPSHIVLPVIR